MKSSSSSTRATLVFAVPPSKRREEALTPLRAEIAELRAQVAELRDRLGLDHDRGGPRIRAVPSTPPAMIA